MTSQIGAHPAPPCTAASSGIINLNALNNNAKRHLENLRSAPAHCYPAGRCLKKDSEGDPTSIRETLQSVLQHSPLIADRH